MRKIFYLLTFTIIYSAILGQKVHETDFFSNFQTKQFNSNEINKVEYYLDLYIHYNSKNTDSALYCAKKAFELANSINFYEGKIRAMTNIGSVHFFKGEFSNALKSFIASNDMTETYIDKNGLDSFAMRQRSKNFNNIALIYLNEQNYDEAEKYLKQSLELDLKLQDVIYVFTDGFADQFGGPKGKKFMSKPFKELLLSIQDETMDEQKIILEKKLEDWRGDNEQIDDVCIIGVRI